MSRQWWHRAAVLSVVSFPTALPAQECTTSITQTVQTAETVQAALDALAGCILAQSAVIQGLNAKLESAVPAVGEHEKTRAIVAYYSEKGEKRCPTGWRPYEEAKERFIVGASSEGRYPVVGGIGGEAETTLSDAHIPSHGHGMFTNSGAAEKDYPGGTQNVAVSANMAAGGLQNESFEYQLRPGTGSPTRGVTGSAGSGHPHNNMPPYIALYFCEKE